MDAALEERLKVLLDKQDIVETLVRMTRGFDRLDKKLIMDAYHDDAIYVHWTFPEPVIGNEAIADTLLNFLQLPRFKTVTHFLLQNLVEVDGDVAFSENHALTCQYRVNEAGEETVYARALRLLHRWERRDGKTWKVAYRTARAEGWHIGQEAPSSYQAYPPHAFGERGPGDPTYNWVEEMRLKTAA